MATGDEPLAAEPAQAREPDAPPAAAGPGDGIMALTEGLERLTVKVEELGRLGQRDADLVDRLHAENQKLRAGELTQAMAPFVRDVMRVHDDIVRLERGNDEADPASGDLSLVRRQLLGVLSRAGLERFDIAGGTAFDPSRHQGVGVVDTQDADADAVVAAMIRCGFAWADGRVLRPAEVTVQRFRPAETTST
ncbi:MAG: nucleotide exchange factor GrpE [Acidimicrobiales bacterium]